MAMLFVFWHWKGYPLPASLTTGRIGELVTSLKKLKAEKVYMVRQKLHRRSCLGELSHFKMTSTVFACKNREDGRWFIEFKEDGTVRIGLPPGGTRRYQPPGQKQHTVDLAEIFTDPITYRRTTSTVLTIQSPYGPRHFRLEPDYSINEPALACRKLLLHEIGDDAIPPFRLEATETPEEGVEFFSAPQSAPGPTTEPTPEPTPEPTTEPTPEPIPELELTPKPTAGPTAELIIEPTAGSTAGSASELRTRPRTQLPPRLPPRLTPELILELKAIPATSEDESYQP